MLSQRAGDHGAPRYYALARDTVRRPLGASLAGVENLVGNRSDRLCAGWPTATDFRHRQHSHGAQKLLTYLVERGCNSVDVLCTVVKCASSVGVSPFTARPPNDWDEHVRVRVTGKPREEVRLESAAAREDLGRVDRRHGHVLVKQRQGRFAKPREVARTANVCDLVDGSSADAHRREELTCGAVDLARVVKSVEEALDRVRDRARADRGAVRVLERQPEGRLDGIASYLRPLRKVFGK
jgi:hypothetical protein